MASRSKIMYKINQVNPAYKFKPMHAYLLAELGKDTPINELTSNTRKPLEICPSKQRRPIRNRKDTEQEKRKSASKVVRLQSTHVGIEQDPNIIVNHHHHGIHRRLSKIH